MSSDKFLELELDSSKQLYTEVIFALDEIGDFVPKDELRRRRYVKYLPVVKTYISSIESAILENKSKGTLDKLFGSNKKSIELIEDYKEDNKKAFNQIKDCMKCKCFKCMKECRMEACNRCEEGYGCRIASCDNETTAVYLLKTKTLELNNDVTGEVETHKVLGIIQDLEVTTLYIYTEVNGEEKVYYFYPGTEDDTYGCITDIDDFNFAVNAFRNASL